MTPVGRRFVVAAVVAALGAATAVGADRELRARDNRSLHRAEAGVAYAVGTRVTNLNLRVNQFSAALERTSHQRIEGRLAAAPRTDFSSVGLVTTDSSGAAHLSHTSTRGSSDQSAFAADLAQPAVRSAEYIARDTAAPIAVITSPAGKAAIVVAWPLYAGAAPGDTQMRRQQSTGWIVGAAPLAVTIAPILNVFAPLDIRAGMSVTDAGPGQLPTVLAGGVTVGVTHFPKQSRLPLLFILIVSAVATIAICGLAVARRRAEQRAFEHDRSLEQQVKLLSDISITVQESLDIGLVLPAALTQISHAHGLSYIGIATGTGAATGPLLSIGRRPAMPAPRWDPGMSHAAAGQLVRLPLQRASRTLGHVELVSARGLGAADLNSLRATTDLLANALHNADLYEREQENVRRLRDLDEMKDDFLATVSHELRTPLSVLVGFMSLLARKWDRLTEEDRREAIVKSQAHVTSLAHLVNDLLDFVSERRTRTAMPETIRVNQYVNAVVDQLRPLCERQQLDVRLDDEVNAWTDPRAVERIVGNLVSNAAKYAPAGSVITVSAETRGDAALVTIADQGPGISAEEQQRIFERFYRGESDAARSTRGSGIGLAVVSEWLRTVGARLDIVTAPGAGTRMLLFFPTQANEGLDRAGTVNWLEPAFAQRSITHETA